MIIIIRETPDLSVDRQGKLRALENIITSYGEGKHVLWMPKRTVSDLIDWVELSSYTKRVLYEAKSIVRETKGIEEDFEFHVEVDFDAGARLEVRDASELIVGYSHFMDSSSTQKCIFITENLRDAATFEMGAQIYLCEKNLSKDYGVSFKYSPGGGATTYDNFISHVRDGSFFLCIIDSDLKHPSGPKGSTAKRFNGHQVGLQKKHALEILACHEIENIIPAKIASVASEGLIDTGLIFKSGKHAIYRAFPDHKNGLCIDGAMEADDKHNDEFWKEFYPHKAKKKVWLMPPLGENFLSDCLRLMSKESPRKLLELVDSEHDRLWWKASKLVASWGIAMKKPIH